jgi:hypothetical protein
LPQKETPPCPKRRPLLAPKGVPIVPIPARRCRNARSAGQGCGMRRRQRSRGTASGTVRPEGTRCLTRRRSFGSSTRWGRGSRRRRNLLAALAVLAATCHTCSTCSTCRTCRTLPCTLVTAAVALRRWALGNLQMALLSSSTGEASVTLTWCEGSPLFFYRRGERNPNMV